MAWMYSEMTYPNISFLPLYRFTALPLYRFFKKSGAKNV
jgi:hypothetical protein